MRSEASELSSNCLPLTDLSAGRARKGCHETGGKQGHEDFGGISAAVLDQPGAARGAPGRDRVPIGGGGDRGGEVRGSGRGMGCGGKEEPDAPGLPFAARGAKSRPRNPALLIGVARGPRQRWPGTRGFVLRACEFGNTIRA
jgi:hypothetical protein